MLGLAMALFAAHPDQWAALRADPALIKGPPDGDYRLRMSLISDRRAEAAREAE